MCRPSGFDSKIDKPEQEKLAVMTKMIAKTNFIEKYIDEINISYYDKVT